MVEKINDSNFSEKVLSSTGKVVVDFSATWCGPCRMMAPILEEISSEYAGQVCIYKVDIDESRMTPMQYGISAVPSLLVFQDGKLVNQAVGAQPKENILSFLGLK